MPATALRSDWRGRHPSAERRDRSGRQSTSRCADRDRVDRVVTRVVHPPGVAPIARDALRRVLTLFLREKRASRLACRDLPHVVLNGIGPVLCSRPCPVFSRRRHDGRSLISGMAIQEVCLARPNHDRCSAEIRSAYVPEFAPRATPGRCSEALSANWRNFASDSDPSIVCGIARRGNSRCRGCLAEGRRASA
jgi:hypothetical protein